MSKKEAAHHYRAMGQRARPAGGVSGDDEMLRYPEVERRTGLSLVTIWRRVRAGTFPAPRELGLNSVGWPESEIAEWVANRPRRGPDIAPIEPQPAVA